jgi:predicted transcriptional regulator
MARDDLEMAMHMDEQQRREAALASLGGDVIDAREIAPREVRQMISVRVEPRLVGDLREIAEARGAKVSDLLREAVTRFVAEFRSQPIQVATWAMPEAIRLEPMVAFSSFSASPSTDTSFKVH